MTSIDFSTLMTHVFVLVDDWFQEHVEGVGQSRRGARARFSDSEVISLALLMDYLPFPGETQFISFIRANYLDWFPELLDVIRNPSEKARDRFSQATSGIESVF